MTGISNTDAPARGPNPELRRTLGLAALTVFGVGDILGAGVYALVGKVAGMVGTAAWTSYVLAGVTAALTGLTYAEFSSRFPKAGGAAHFCAESWRRAPVTFFVIFFVVLSGLFSMAMSARTFSNYLLSGATGVPGWARDFAVPAGFALLLAAVAARGIVISSAANAVCTAVEVSGLLAVIVVGIPRLGGANYLQFATPVEGGVTAAALAVVSGASLSFFAFVGFEDMANLSEEVKNPTRTVPLAICFAIAITAVIYCTIVLVCVSVLSPAVLGASKSPVIDVVRAAAPGFPVWVYKFIPAFAVFNTALLNLLMASRLLYGMARQQSHLLPAVFGYVHPGWRTPIVGVAASLGVVLALLASVRDIATLASGTSTFLLVVFLLLHAGLLKMKLSPAAGEPPAFRIPTVVPALGVATTVALLAAQQKPAVHAALLMSALIALLYVTNRLMRGRVRVEAVD